MIIDYNWRKHLPFLLINSDMTIIHILWTQLTNHSSQSLQNFASCKCKFNMSSSCWIGSMLIVFDAVCGCVMMKIRLILRQMLNLQMWLVRFIIYQYSTGIMQAVSLPWLLLVYSQTTEQLRSLTDFLKLRFPDWENLVSTTMSLDRVTSVSSTNQCWFCLCRISVNALVTLSTSTHHVCSKTLDSCVTFKGKLNAIPDRNAETGTEARLTEI